mgnify:FL=1
MKDLFANLYNKVLSFFHQTESTDGEASKNVACNRLKLVLMQDRTNLSPAIMDRMRHELIDLLSKYLELDRELLDLNFEQEDEQMALMLSIPVIRAKDEEEIQAILKLEDEALTKESDEYSDSEEECEEESEEDNLEEGEEVEGSEEEELVKESEADDEEETSKTDNDKE